MVILTTNSGLSDEKHFLAMRVAWQVFASDFIAGLDWQTEKMVLSSFIFW